MKKKYLIESMKEGTPEFDKEVEILSTYLARNKTLAELRRYQRIVNTQIEMLHTKCGGYVNKLSILLQQALDTLCLKQEGVRIAIDKHEFQKWDDKEQKYIEKY